MTDFWGKWAPFFEIHFWGISVKNAVFFAIFLIVAIVFSEIFFAKILKIFEKMAKKTTTKFDDLAANFLKKMRFPAIFLIAILGARIFLPLSAKVQKAFEAAGFLIGLFLATIFAFRAIDFVAAKMAKKVGIRGFPVLTKIAKIAVVILIAIIGLSNLGFDVTGIVAGLGVGGIAIALAAQNILSDLFASISISVDRPFVVGDFIEVGEISGTVENIGIKTTRLRTLNGEEVSIPNAKLTAAEIHNFSRIKSRRGKIAVGVEYSTDEKKLKKIPEFLKAIADAEKNVEFVRAHLVNFGESSIDFEMIFKSLSPEFSDLVAAREKLFYKIFEKFSAEKIVFAFPTRTIFVEKDEKEKT